MKNLQKHHHKEEYMTPMDSLAITEVDNFYRRITGYWSELSYDPERGSTGLLNFGCWDSGDQNLHDAQLRLFEIIAELLKPVRKNASGLEVGCGIGGNVIRLCECYPVNMTALDISQAQLEVAMQRADRTGNATRINFIHGDAMNMPFENALFDFSICIESSFHYPEISRYVKEQFRVIKPGAKVIIADITCEDNSKVKFRQGNHFYSVHFMRNLLLEQGFNVINVHRIGQYVFAPLYDYLKKFSARKKSKTSKYWNLVLMNYSALCREGTMGYDIFEIEKPPIPKSKLPS